MEQINNVAIVVAMEKELNLLLPLVNEPKELVIDGYRLYSGTINGMNVTIMQCGIGKVNAAIGTLTLLNNFNVDVVINTGVAGGADKSINVMDIVVATQITYHDVWCGPGTQYGEASGYPLFFTSDNDLVDLLDDEEGVKPGLICSGDRFIASIEEIESIKAHFPNALAVDMESAAIAQVCKLRDVPFLCIRVISDSPGTSNDNSAQYDNFWEIAPQHTFNIVRFLLSKF
ncbi:MAG: 5'-methylthioadenosine/adenosylhomocysteine nucleosidase [Bacteroidales bacterium]|nr:5'-methylthioadenosine/adenosylhomocysteine nucleosidase [Bacteroidales bacterium]